MPIRVAMTGLAAGLAVVALAVTSPAAQAAPPAGCTVTQLLELKATMEGMKPMVTVGIDGHDERFIVDSGAFYSTISSGKAAELGLYRKAMAPNFVLKGIGGQVDASYATIRKVTLAGVALTNINFIVGGGEIGNGAGLLGQNVLGFADVEYDLAHGAVRLMRAKDCKGAVPVYWSTGSAVSTVAIQPRDARNPHTIGTVLVNGVKIRAFFDTGASSTVMSLAAAARIGLKPDTPGVRQIGYERGMGRNTSPLYSIPIDSIALGDQETVRRTHLRAAAMDLGDAEMLIGADFFLSHRVYVANGLGKLFFTYDGGPIFNVTPGRIVDQAGGAVALPADVGTEPTDAAGFSRRGAASMARRDLPRALADFDKAVAMAPTESGYLLQRAQARLAAREPLLAMDDIDAALKLDPANAEARLARASIRLARHDRAAAEVDVASVDGAAAPAADARLTLAGMYNRLDQPAKAIAQYDLWLRYHGEDSRRPTALNGRCWARAQLGIELGKALSDCDAAVKARPNAAAYFDSRGLVRLRMGDNDKAIRDYDAALAIEPKLAWPLYGRGLARQRSGDKAGGDADIAAATAIDAGIAARARAIGIGG